MPAPSMARRTPVRCVRCARTQPPLPSGVYQCVYCGTALPLQRWVAHPPPAEWTPTVTRRRAIVRHRYAGPPGYRNGHPRWGFAPSVWRWTDDGERPERTRPPIGELRTAAAFAFATAVASLVAAGAEAWRFSLMLRGRTEVLPGGPVVASDQLVAYSSWIALVLALITAIVAVPALVQSHRAAADHAGLTPSRSTVDVWLRLVVPGWNVWGAGQILTETEGTLAGRMSDAGRPRTSALLRWWWLCWGVSAVLVLLAIARTFFPGLQAIADTVELHIAVDGTAVAVGILSGLALLRLVRLFRPRPSRLSGWRVAGPQPSRERLSGSAAAAARRHSGVLPVDPAEVRAARLARPVTLAAGADLVLADHDDDADRNDDPDRTDDADRGDDATEPDRGPDRAEMSGGQPPAAPTSERNLPGENRP